MGCDCRQPLQHNIVAGLIRHLGPIGTSLVGPGSFCPNIADRFWRDTVLRSQEGRCGCRFGGLLTEDVAGLVWGQLVSLSLRKSLDDNWQGSHATVLLSRWFLQSSIRAWVLARRICNYRRFAINVVASLSQRAQARWVISYPVNLAERPSPQPMLLVDLLPGAGAAGTCNFHFHVQTPVLRLDEPWAQNHY